jgi:hypothetical protein
MFSSFVLSVFYKYRHEFTLSIMLQVWEKEKTEAPKPKALIPLNDSLWLFIVKIFENVKMVFKTPGK